MKLIAIDQSGNPEESIVLPDIAKDAAQGNVANYKQKGFEKPWIAYFAVENGNVVGCCAFKTPPQDKKVEIAYFTFPQFEGKGVATKMAKMLVDMANSADSEILVTAQTLPEKNASTSILTKLGFIKTRNINHPDDGEVWEWELSKENRG